MATQFEYGPLLRLGEEKQKQFGKQNIDSDNTSISESIRDYSDPETDLKNIKYYPRSHLATPQNEDEQDSENETTLSLGSHWKQVATVNEDDSSLYSQTTLLTLPVIHNKERDAESVELRRIVNLQHDNIDEIQSTLRKTRRVLNNSFQKSANDYYLITMNTEEIRDELKEKIDKLEDKNDEYLTKMDENVQELLEYAHQTIDIIDNKNRISKFIKNNSKYLMELSNSSLFIESNMKRIQNAKNLIDYSLFERSSDLTVFEHEDYRIYESVNKLHSFIRNLPLKKEEKQKMENIIEKTEKNEKVNGKLKCEMIFRELLAIMSKWMNENGGGKSEKSSIDLNWQNIKGPFDSSSFYLSESNLTDLEQELQNSKIKQAVQEPNNCLEFDRWSSASSFVSSWNTSGRTSIQSVNEPMSLSSYEAKTSTWGSTSQSSSLDEQLNEMRRSLDDCDMKTAFSADKMVHPMPRRSTSQLEEEKEFSAPLTRRSSTSTCYSSDVFSFSSISLVDMIDDALHTAKEVVDNNAQNLLTALQDSANKCGVAISSLMSNASSSESESATQSSHSSTTARSTRLSAEKTEFTQ